MFTEFFYIWSNTVCSFDSMTIATAQNTITRTNAVTYWDSKYMIGEEGQGFVREQTLENT